MKHPPAELRRYAELVAGAQASITSVRDPAELWDVHIEDALTAGGLVEFSRLIPAGIQADEYVACQEQVYGLAGYPNLRDPEFVPQVVPDFATASTIGLRAP